MLRGLGAVAASELRLKSGDVQFSPDIEPLVRMLEETPRERLVEIVAQEIKAGKLVYRQLLAGLFLAAVRNVQPRPSVGFKFHAVLVINSAHLASLNSPAKDRWLPLLWAVDEFKSSQARDISEGNWTMPAVDESGIVAPHRVAQQFTEAMESWDEAKADTAAAGLARYATQHQAFELFARYAARDFRSIGHKVIFLANSFRTLDVIGWRYAEPILRSLAYALLNHEGQPNPATSDQDVDRPWRVNQRLAAELPVDWQSGKTEVAATRDVLAGLRGWQAVEASEQVAKMLASGVSLQAVHDGLLLAGSEMLMRQPGIVSLHSLTTTNAMQYLVRTVQDDQLRRQLVLQNAAFLPLFLQSMRGRGELRDRSLDDLQPELAEAPQNPGSIFEILGKDPDQAASLTKAWVSENSAGLPELMTEARRLIFLKGNDSHDYKYSSAILEDVESLSPAWRSDFMAATLYKLRSSSDATTGLVKRIQAALA